MLAGEAQLAVEIVDPEGSVIAHGATGTYAGHLHDMPLLAIEGVALEMSLLDRETTYVATCRLLSEREFEVGTVVDVAVVHVVTPDVHAAEVAAAQAADDAFLGSNDSGMFAPHRTNESVVVSLDDDDEPTGVSGTLREMPVIEIVQMLTAGRRTAVVDIKGKGKFAVEGGAVVYAQCGNLVSNEAFVALYAFRRGTFRIRYGRKAPEQNIFAPTTFLLLEAARLFDEATAAPDDIAPIEDRSEEQSWQVMPPSLALPHALTPAPREAPPREPTLRFRSLMAEALPEASSTTPRDDRDE